MTFLDRKLSRWLRKARGDNRAKLVDTLGYVIGAEYGADRGWHLHATVFLNGDRWEDDAGIADLIGKHWVRDITSGEGQYENCNRRKKRYGRRLAIGKRPAKSS